MTRTRFALLYLLYLLALAACGAAGPPVPPVPGIAPGMTISGSASVGLAQDGG